MKDKRVIIGLIITILLIVLMYFIVIVYSEVQEKGKSNSGAMQGKSEQGVTTEGYTPSSNPVDKENELQYEKEQVRRVISRNATYPALSKSLKQSGNVVVEFIIRNGGTISSVSLVKSSGYPLLDKTSIETVEKSSGQLPNPPKPFKMQMTFNYKENTTKPVVR